MNGDGRQTRHHHCEEPETPSLDLHELKVTSAIGRGAKGVVFLAQNQKDGELLALKTMSREWISKDKENGGDDQRIRGEDRRTRFEKEVLRSFQHSLLPKLRGVVSTDSIVGYAIDYCPGGNLNSLRHKQTEKMFSDDIIRFYAAELVLALEYLHSLGIVYRDLKPENVMIQENGHLMLVDFDLSTKLSAKPGEDASELVPKSEPTKRKKLNRLLSFCSSGISTEYSIHPANYGSSSMSNESESASKSNSFVGTVEYVAPEIIQGDGHDFAVDWWCLGIVLYEILYGTTPFRGANRKETFYRILSKSPELYGEQTCLRDLIGKLLEKDPKKRPSVDEIKCHDFFCGIDWDLILKIGRPPYIPVTQLPECEDKEENIGIDVEAFVREVFEMGKDSDDKQNKLIKGLNQATTKTDSFFIF